MGVHPIEHFRRQLEEFGAYPSGVVPVPAYLPGTAFFAASAGLYRRAGSHLLPPFPYGGWMFVGHNFDAEGPFRRRLESGHSHGDPARPMRTWQNLYKLLAKAGVDPRECFFTNAYVGLKEGDDPTGRSDGIRWEFPTRQVGEKRYGPACCDAAAFGSRVPVPPCLGASGVELRRR